MLASVEMPSTILPEPWDSEPSPELAVAVDALAGCTGWGFFNQSDRLLDSFGKLNLEANTWRVGYS